VNHPRGAKQFLLPGRQKGKKEINHKSTNHQKTKDQRKQIKDGPGLGTKTGKPPDKNKTHTGWVMTEQESRKRSVDTIGKRRKTGEWK